MVGFTKLENDLWVPAGATHTGVVSAGRNSETGDSVVANQFTFKVTDKFGVEHKQKIIIPADKNVSQAHVEEMAGHAYENFVNEVRNKYTKRPPTAQEKKDIGQALERFRRDMVKRRASTNRKLHF